MPDVSTPSLAYVSMVEKWDMLHDLIGGTFVMRAAREKWLPQETKEKHQKYEIRLGRSFLYNALKSTIKKLSSKPFTRAVTIRGDLPDALLENNVDNAGTNLTQFARKAFESAVTYGLTHILVDFPTVDEPLNLQSERKLRPAMILIPPPDMLGWTSEIRVGEKVLTSIRYKENRIVATDFKEEIVEYVRIINEVDWQLWRRDKEGWKLDSEGPHTFGGVPLVTVYIDKTGFMTADPPLEDLAHVNIAHWQSQSDQRNILRFARMGIIAITGITEEEMPKIVIGPNNFIQIANKDAEVFYVEHSGAAIGAGADDIVHLEELMETLGLQPMLQRSAQATATGKLIEEGKTQSDIQAWIRALENALNIAIQFAAKWTKVETDAIVDIFNDFALSNRSTSELELMSKMQVNGQMSRETFLKETKRRGVVSEDLVVDEELDRIDGDIRGGE